MDRYAFFDFDGTLINGDSFGLFARFALGNMTFIKALLCFSPWIFAWKFGMVSNGRAKEVLFGNLFKGYSYEKFLKRECAFPRS